MRTLIWFIYFWGYMLFHLPALRRGLKALDAGDWATADALAAKHVPHWAGRLLKLAGVTVTVEGLENIPKGRPCVFAGNHRSYYDIPLVLTQLDAPHGLVAKKEVAKLPLVRSWMRLLHCVFLDREDPRKAMTALNEAIDLVKKGYSLTIFPEGTRNKGTEGSLLEFKSGAFRVATKAKAPIVPLAITGSRDIMENHHMFMHPAHVTIRVLEPIETEGLTKEVIRALPQRTADVIARHLPADTGIR